VQRAAFAVFLAVARLPTVQVVFASRAGRG